MGLFEGHPTGAHRLFLRLRLSIGLRKSDRGRSTLTTYSPITADFQWVGGVLKPLLRWARGAGAPAAPTGLPGGDAWRP